MAFFFGLGCFDDREGDDSWFANELACRYAGDATRPVRGVLSNEGSLPTEAAHAVTCSGKPMAGTWVYETLESPNPFRGDSVPIDRAMLVNGCTAATGNGRGSHDNVVNPGFATFIKLLSKAPLLAP